MRWLDASPTWWTWVWASSGSWWWTGKPGMLQSMRSQRVRHNWVTEQTEMGKSGNSDKFIFLSSEITADSDCSHKIKRCLLLGRKAITNPDSILNSRDITLSTKVCLVKAIVFPVVMYGCENWTIKEAECWRINAVELWCWRQLLIVPWETRRSNQSNLKEISPKYSLEGLILKLQL